MSTFSRRTQSCDLIAWASWAEFRPPARIMAMESFRLDSPRMIDRANPSLVLAGVMGTFPCV